MYQNSTISIVIKLFLNVFAKNGLFETRTTFFESLINHERFVFES